MSDEPDLAFALRWLDEAARNCVMTKDEAEAHAEQTLALYRLSQATERTRRAEDGVSDARTFYVVVTTDDRDIRHREPLSWNDAVTLATHIYDHDGSLDSVRIVDGRTGETEWILVA